MAGHFFRAVVEQARKAGLMSSEHFSVDGTLIEAWASLKSFRPKDDEDSDNNGWADFRGKKRSNDTHEAKTDPDSRLMRKGHGKEAKLSFCLSAVMENRNGLAVGAGVSQATGTAERVTALELLDEIPRTQRITVSGDKGYDTRDFVAGLRDRNAVPHVAQKVRFSAIDGRVTRHDGYETSQRKRKRVEEIFGWVKTIALMRKTRHRGTARVGWMFTFALAAYNLVRMRNLIAVTA